MKTCMKWLCGVIMGAAVVVVIAVPLALRATRQERELDPRPTFQLEDYFNDSFWYNTYRLQWISGNEYIHTTKEKTVVQFNVETGSSLVILENSTVSDSNATYFALSADQNFALLRYNYKKLWRHSYTASYHIYDIKNGSLVTTNVLPDTIQYIAWSPVGQKLVYVFKNNIYMKENPSSEAVNITTNGEENKILNGIPDWVYEEELLISNYALWWSPNADYLAYVEFNDTNVPLIEYSWYGADTKQYPETNSIPYPKAGAPNPTVRLFIADTQPPVSEPYREIAPPALITSSEYYFCDFKWVTDERISVQWIRRIQNVSVVSICDSEGAGATWNCQKNIEEQSTTGWIGNFHPSEPYFAPDNLTYYKIVSNSDGYKHIHRFNITHEEALTSGTFEVTWIATVTKAFLYYISNEGFPGSRNLYKLNISNNLNKPECVSCALRTERCKSYSAYFSKNSEYYRLTCRGPGVPIYTIHRSGDDKEIQVLEDNKNLELKLNDIQMPSYENKTITLHGLDLWYKLILPPHFDRSKKYPLLIYVYAGPGSQNVNPVFRINWATYLASTENIIVASFDGRGSGYQGDRIMHALYRRLGTVEVEDQISAARQFISMGFIDEKRVAIWGWFQTVSLKYFPAIEETDHKYKSTWSYGGYVTSMVLGSNSGVFKCGIAVAPVSSWQYYASIYTERYMSLPTKEDNLGSYENSTVMARAANFKDVQYLLIHGTADDNVHFQQAAQISQALVDAQVDFEAMWYTDKDHAIGGNAFRHIFTHMSHFVKKCFAVPSIDSSS